MKKILSAMMLLSAVFPMSADDVKEEKNDSTGGFVFTDVKVLKLRRSRIRTRAARAGVLRELRF